MEEKERYEVISPSLNGYAYIHDFKTDNVLNTYDSCDLLNQQSKRIKELEKENQQLKQQLEELNESLYQSNIELYAMKNLRQQLHDLPKKIVEDCKMALIKRINIISGYGRMTIDEQSFFFENEYGKDLDIILKKYGGENE